MTLPICTNGKNVAGKERNSKGVRLVALYTFSVYHSVYDALNP